jgi:hypothetical protein
MYLVLGYRRSVGERLANVFLLEVRVLGNYLCGRHSVRHQVYYVCNRYAQAAQGRASRENIRVMCDAIMGSSHRNYCTQRQRRLLRYLCLGSSASRSPSPSRLNDRTSRKIDRPGQIDIHGAWSM